jgi:hypothetical protein
MSGLCVAEILTCDKDIERLEVLKGRAEAQRTSNSTEFEDPYSWGFDFCKHLPKAIHFVASTDDIVCGWALLEAESFFGVKTMEIAAITTRRKQMGTQRIGRLLHDTIVKYAEDNGKDLIILHAKNADVAKIYGKWGYVPFFREEEIRALEASQKVKDSGKDDKFRAELSLMMYCPIKSDIMIPDKFKAMIIKDAENMTLLGYYGTDRPTEGGRRKTRRRKFLKASRFGTVYRRYKRSTRKH